MLDDDEAPVLAEPVDVLHRRAVNDVDIATLERRQPVGRAEDRRPLDPVELGGRPVVAVEALGDDRSGAQDTSRNGPRAVGESKPNRSGSAARSASL